MMQQDPSSPRLTIAIATMETRLDQLSLPMLPPIPGIVWRIFAQGNPETIARHATRLARADVTLTATEGRGAARSRNAALEAVWTEYLLFADDDLIFDPAGIATLLARFEAQPATDFLCACLSDETGRPRKRYSPDRTPVRWFNCGKIGTPELALRPARLRAKAVRFDTSFGAGASDWLGDEYIFLCDALRAGLRGQHVAVTVASHPANSSGLTQGVEAMAVRRRVLIRALGRLKSLPVRLSFAIRHRRTIGGWRGWLAFLRP
jgi:hypothetical protein